MYGNSPQAWATWPTALARRSAAAHRAAMRVPPALLVPALFAVASAGLAGCDRGTPALVSDQQLLEFRRASLHRQLESDSGSLSEAFERGDVVISVRERLLRDLIAASLPFEHEVADRFVITADDVEVDLQPGVALVEFAGRASPVAFREATIDILILASLELLELAPQSPDLRAKLSVLGFQVRGLEVGGLLPPVERLVNELGRSRLGLFTDLLGEIEIPIRLEQEITLPAVDTEEVTIPAARLPLSSEVRGVFVGEDRLWVSVGVSIAPIPLDDAIEVGADGGRGSSTTAGAGAP